MSTTSDAIKFDLTCTIKLSMDDKFLREVLTVAADGGIDHWVQQFNFRDFDGETYKEVEVVEMEDEDANPVDNPVHKITAHTVFKGINTILTHPTPNDIFVGEDLRNRILQSCLENDTTEGDLDAGDCDTIVQVGLFGHNQYS